MGFRDLITLICIMLFFYWSGDNLIFEDLKKNLALPISQYNIYLSGKCNIGNRAHKLVSVLTIPPLIKVFRNFSVFLLVIIKSPLKTIYFIRFWKICEIVSENSNSECGLSIINRISNYSNFVSLGFVIFWK